MTTPFILWRKTQPLTGARYGRAVHRARRKLGLATVRATRRYLRRVRGFQWEPCWTLTNDGVHTVMTVEIRP